MSACISRQGEYSDHVLADTADPERFICQRCFALDEALRVAERKVASAFDVLNEYRGTNSKIARRLRRELRGALGEIS